MRSCGCTVAVAMLAWFVCGLSYLSLFSLSLLSSLPFSPHSLALALALSLKQSSPP